MKIDLITRAQLEAINKRNLRYPLADAEKDYFLAVILKIIYSSFLADSLVFKGGTAIHHCYLEQLRFSSDLDFTTIRTINLIKLKKIFDEHEFINIKNLNKRKYSLNFYLQYRGILQQPNSINININTNQKVLLKPKWSSYGNYYNVDVKVNLMNIKEIAAEKIRTLNERIRGRDFYDLYLIKSKFKLNLKEAIEILRRKELFRPFSKESLKENMHLALEAYDSEINNLYLKQFVSKENLNSMIREIIKEI
jgi:predicted nucleotidyltransferase component of viral defense system